MKISFLTVGRTDAGWVREGLETYISRLGRYVPFSLTEIPALKNASSLTRAQVKEKEGVLILKNIKPSDRVILLDEHGKEFTSEGFARELESMMARCDGKLSLSRMTFPHQMVRVVFAEQLYRAFTIMKGEPYHHE